MRNLLLVLFACSIAACTPYDPDLGPSPFLCGPLEQDPRCPDGYTCTMMGTAEYCLAMGGTVPVDGNNLNCADDSSLEPNDMISQAFQTPVATQKNTLTFAGLAICPAGDADNYAVTITAANQNLEVLIEFDPAGADLAGSILNSGGTPIANASPTAAGMKRAYTPNLPTGVYYAKVSGPMMGTGVTTNNYKMTINVTGP
ncbi:MAG TPA: hypothetical protein VIV11_30090 [Kofleriaceae bacterium]